MTKIKMQSPPIKKRNLFLFTYSFPFGKGESFLETEVPLLNLHFNLTIIPQRVIGITRTIPGNISVDATLSSFIDKYSLKKIYTIFYSLKFILRHFKRQYIFLLFRFIKTAHSTNNISKWAEKNISINSESTLYTYWYNETSNALALSNVKFSKLVTRVHRFDLYEERYKPPLIPFRSETIHRFTKIFSISNDGKKYLLDKHNAKNVTVSKLGTSDHFSCNLFSQDNKIRIVSCSFIHPVKRLDRVLGALIDLSKSGGRQIEWVHLGDGDAKIKNEILAVNSKFTNLSIKILGHLENKEVLEYYKNNHVDVFINTSESEGIPVSIMEVISFGIPTIALNVGGISEIVNRETGILLDEFASNKKISEAIREIYLEDIVTKFKRRERCLHFWEKNHRAQENYSIFSNLLKN